MELCYYRRIEDIQPTYQNLNGQKDPTVLVGPRTFHRSECTGRLHPFGGNPSVKCTVKV